MVASLPIAPEVEKTRGVKTPCSTSRMRCPYSLFLACSWVRKRAERGLDLSFFFQDQYKICLYKCLLHQIQYAYSQLYFVIYFVCGRDIRNEINESFSFTLVIIYCSSPYIYRCITESKMMVGQLITKKSAVQWIWSSTLCVCSVCVLCVCVVCVYVCVVGVCVCVVCVCVCVVCMCLCCVCMCVCVDRVTERKEGT